MVYFKAIQNVNGSTRAQVAGKITATWGRWENGRLHWQIQAVNTAIATSASEFFASSLASVIVDNPWANSLVVVNLDSVDNIIRLDGLADGLHSFPLPSMCIAKIQPDSDQVIYLPLNSQTRLPIQMATVKHVSKAITTNWLTAVAPINTPSVHRLQLCVEGTTTIVNVMLYDGTNTISMAVNGGNACIAGAGYQFDVVMLPGYTWTVQHATATQNVNLQAIELPYVSG